MCLRAGKFLTQLTDKHTGALITVSAAWSINEGNGTASSRYHFDNRGRSSCRQWTLAADLLCRHQSASIRVRLHWLSFVSNCLLHLKSSIKASDFSSLRLPSDVENSCWLVSLKGGNAKTVF